MFGTFINAETLQTIHYDHVHHSVLLLNRQSKPQVINSDPKLETDSSSILPYPSRVSSAALHMDIKRSSSQLR